MNSKQRAYLRGMANDLQPIFQVGKGGITENMTKQIGEALEARELIKVTVLKTALVDTKSVAQEVAAAVDAEVVQVIGSKCVLYRESKESKNIILPW
ncbi:MAG: ribosome assembly RNA-binding protein YhbY [Clostridia bacterium]